MKNNQIEEVKNKTDIVSLISEYIEVKKAVRIWPHLNDTDGFFIARIRK